MTIGVRALCIMDEAVLLVRHGYYPGLHLPGGEVDPGETAEQAARRELREETGVIAVGSGQLLGLYFNTHFTDRDHVAVYVFDAVHIGQARRPGFEIAESGWFALSDLPADLSEATRNRLAEVAGHKPVSPYW